MSKTKGHTGKIKMGRAIETWPRIICVREAFVIVMQKFDRVSLSTILIIKGLVLPWKRKGKKKEGGGGGGWFSMKEK